MWAKTRGGSINTVGREIDYEVCGSEGAILSDSSPFVKTYLYWTPDQTIGGKRYATQDISALINRFSSTSTTCPITEISLFDSNNLTPLATNADIIL